MFGQRYIADNNLGLPTKSEDLSVFVLSFLRYYYVPSFFGLLGV